MKIALYIKKKALVADQSVMAFAEKLKQAGCEVYDVATGLQAGTDMLLSVGGDGTFLSSSRIVAEAGVPVLGVNLGRLGFLSEAKLDGICEPLISGDWAVEEREMLHVRTVGFEIKDFWPYALNEVSFHRTGAGILESDVVINGNSLPTYWSDGMLVSTSSGSTAYSLSVGGPICMPDVEAFIVSPIAPHNLNVRPLVVASSASISVKVRSKDDKLALMALDNRDFLIPTGASVEICAAPFKLRRVVLGKSNFIGALRSKLFWGEDVRNGQ